MDKFFETCYLHRLKGKNENSAMFIIEIKFIMKILPTKKTIGSKYFTIEFNFLKTSYQSFTNYFRY